MLYLRPDVARDDRLYSLKPSRSSSVIAAPACSVPRSEPAKRLAIGMQLKELLASKFTSLESFYTNSAGAGGDGTAVARSGGAPRPPSTHRGPAAGAALRDGAVSRESAAATSAA